jgi:hypothetical protein
VPQLVLSVDRFEHVPAQLLVPVGHAHWLFTHTRSPPQASKQSPQLALLEVRSTHEAPHCERPLAAHRTAQVPSLQIGAVAGHALPHAPQFVLLDDVSTQVPKPLRPTAHCV